MQYRLIACGVFREEMDAAILQAPHAVTVEYLALGLHMGSGEALREKVQAAIDAAEAQPCDAVLLGYGLCNCWCRGIVARSRPLVLPRAHDCISIFLGGRKQHEARQQHDPHTYYRSTGWMELLKDEEYRNHPTGQDMGISATLQELIGRYGDDNGRYLYEQMHMHIQRYDRLTWIDTGGDPARENEQLARQEAAANQWGFDRIPGDLSMIQRMLAGAWNEDDFLVVPPGKQVTVPYGDKLLDWSDAPS